MKENKMVESNDAFVKKEQMKQRGMMGNRPGAPREMMEFNAYMSNDGENAQRACEKVTKGLEDAFPVHYNRNA